MAEKYHQALHLRDFDHQEAQTNRGKKYQGYSVMPQQGFVRHRDPRDRDAQQGHRQCDDKHRAQQHHGFHVEAVISHVPAVAVQNVIEFEHVDSGI